MATYLVTGAAGFIGYHLTLRLLADGHVVVGLDNLNDYYDLRLKEARLARLLGRPGFDFVKLDLVNRAGMEALFLANKFDRVIHLAAQAGVRYSISNPHAFINSNITGFLNVLEGCRSSRVPHLVFASSSSVYGGNTRLPHSPHAGTAHPLSLDAATKKSNELMAHVYAHLHQLPCTGLRLFTVYGPWGRPDMAMFVFTKAIIEGTPIDVFNNGNHKRDYTYVDDVVEGLIRVQSRIPAPDPNWAAAGPDPAAGLDPAGSPAPYRLFNIGTHRPIDTLYLIKLLEGAIGRKARLNMLPHQPGDLLDTDADIEELTQYAGYRPRTSVEEGVRLFLAWYKEYYRI